MQNLAGLEALAAWTVQGSSAVPSGQEHVPPSLSPAACPQAQGQELVQLLEQKPILDPDIPYFNFSLQRCQVHFTNALCSFF